MDATQLPDPLFIDEPDLSAEDPSQKDGFRVAYDKEVRRPAPFARPRHRPNAKKPRAPAVPL